MANLAEHKMFGDSVVLHGLDEKGNVITLNNNEVVTFGDVIALAGDFVAPVGLKNISTAPDRDGRRERFLSAYNNLVSREYSGFVHEMKRYATLETNLIKEKREGGEKAADYYRQNKFIRQSWWETLTKQNKSHGVQDYDQILIENFDHFSHSALESYNVGHELAIREMKQAYQLREQSKAKYEQSLMRAYSIEAFACHYLTDLFTAGHMRVPRRALFSQLEKSGIPKIVAAAYAGMQHDEDGDQGLNVTNNNGDTWKAYGDGHFFDDIGIPGKKIIQTMLQGIVDQLHDVSITGIYPKDNLAERYLPRVKVENNMPMFRIKPGTFGYVERRQDLDDLHCAKYTECGDLSTAFNILTLYRKKTARRHSPDLVKLGDTIVIYSKLKSLKQIHWTENGDQYAEYMVYPYTVLDRKQVWGMLFVDYGMIKKLEKELKPYKHDKFEPDLGTYQLKVTRKYQYGQDSAQTFRFLVYHNPERHIFQHRFVDTNIVFQMLSGAISVEIGPELKKLKDALEKLGKSLFGDELRKF